MSTYVNNLRLEEIGTGERSGTWGTATNTNLELIGEALGYGTEAIPTNATTHDSIVADATADAARSMYIKYTGSLNAPCTVKIGPDTMKRVHIIENATTGSQNILIKQGSGGGASVTIPSGATKIVYLDGGGSGAIVTDALASVKIDTTGAITASGAAGVITGTTIEATGVDHDHIGLIGRIYELTIGATQLPYHHFGINPILRAPKAYQMHTFSHSSSYGPSAFNT